MSELDKVIDKITKLLAMANDKSSPNEAMAAARRARALMDKYQIDVATIEQAKGSQFAEQDSDQAFSRMPNWFKYLGVACARLNDCRAVYTNQHTTDSTYVLRFQGFSADVVVAKLTFEYLLLACERGATNSGLKGRSNLNAFRLGFSQGVIKQVNLITAEREQEMMNRETGTSLVVIKTQLVERHFGALRMSHLRSTYSSPAAFDSGVTAGLKTNLSQQVGGSIVPRLPRGSKR